MNNNSVRSMFHRAISLVEEMEKLQDSNAVHQNILRGSIKLTREQALHIAGATDYEALKTEAVVLREALTDFDTWLCGFNPDCAASVREGRKVLIKARKALSSTPLSGT